MAVKLDIDPTWINAEGGDVTYDAGERRGHDTAAMLHNIDPVTPMAGVLHGLVVTVDAARLATIGQGSAELVPVPVSATAGGYRAVVAGVLPSETLTAPDATYSRRDIVCLEVRDPDSTGGTDKGAYMVVKTGTPAASPVAPSPSTGQLLLAEVLVPVSGTPTVIDRRQFTGVAGSIIPCTSAARPNPGAHTRPGQVIYEADTRRSMVWTGSSWARFAEKLSDTGVMRDFTFESGWGRMSSGAHYPSTGWRIKDGWATFALHFRALGSGQPFLAGQWRKIATSAGFRPPTEAMFVMRGVVGQVCSGFGTVSVADGGVYVSSDVDINMMYQDEFILTMVPYRV